MKLRGRTFYLAATLLVLVACSSEAPPSTEPPDTAPAADADAKVDLLSGTWILNVAKSTYSPADLAPKSNKVVFEAAPDGIHVVTDGVNAQGKATHSDYTAKFDGPEVATNGTVDGKPNPDASMASWKQIDEHTFEVTTKGTGQTINTNKIVIAADGKSRTSTVTGKGPKGQALNHMVVMDKQ